LNATTPYNEQALLQKLAAGDERAFTQLYNHYYTQVKLAIQRFVKSPNLTEDLAQEVFIKIWDHHTKLSGVNSFQAYLLTITRNHTLNFLKRAARITEGKTEIIRHARQLYSNTSDDAILKEYLSELNKVYESLPAQTREVFRLVRGEEKSYEEVAALLGISRNTVKKHMVHSNRSFRQSLENDLGISLTVALFILFQK